MSGSAAGTGGFAYGGAGGSGGSGGRAEGGGLYNLGVVTLSGPGATFYGDESLGGVGGIGGQGGQAVGGRGERTRA